MGPARAGRASISEKTGRKVVGFPMVMGIRHASRQVVPSCAVVWQGDGGEGAPSALPALKTPPESDTE